MTILIEIWKYLMLETTLTYNTALMIFIEPTSFLCFDDLYLPS